MDTDDPEPGPIWQLKSPACRVICLAGTDEIKSVAVWSPGHRYWAVRPDRAELDVFRGFAKQVAGEIVASAWPAGGGGIGGGGIGGGGIGAAGAGAAGTSPLAEAAALSAEGAALLSIVQELTEPRLLICRVVGVMAQIAAVHVGFAVPVAEKIGQLAASLASRFIEPGPESPGTRALQYADVTFSVAGDLTEYLDVGRVEIRSRADADRRLRGLDRDPPARRSRTRDIGRQADALPERQAGRAARAPLPGVSRAVQGPPPGVGRLVRGPLPGVSRAARAPLPGVGRPGRLRGVPRYPPGRGGRGELGGPGEPPGRGGPSSR
jgi:hypothetical protein